MINKTALAAVLSAILTLAGCKLATISPASPAAANGTAGPNAMTAYRSLTEADDETFRSAVDAGWVSPTSVIVKATVDLDPALFSRLGARVEGRFILDSCAYYRLSKESDARRLVARLMETTGVIYAENELLSKLPALETSPDASEASPNARNAYLIATALNDPLTWGRYAHFETTGAIDAYTTYGFGPNTAYVVDIDTGINLGHEDFHAGDGSSIVEYAKSAFSTADGGATFAYVGYGNAFVDVPAGQDWDEEGHGSHTAGIIAAIGNNGKGVAGLCWKNVRLISYKCFSESAASGSGGDWAIYGGLADLMTWKADNAPNQTIPVNMSLGGLYASNFEEDMINKALDKGIMIIASAGNDGYNAAQYPAAYSGVLAVGAAEANGRKVSFSQSGDFLSVVAPGYNIYSTFKGGPKAYADMSGTSMAAPFVTGLVAYLLTFDPTLSPDQIKTVIEKTATDMGPAGWDEDTGYGLVNVKAAVSMVKNGNVPASGSTYSPRVLTVSVQNNDANYNSGIVDHAKAIANQAVYLYDDSGKFVAVGLTNATDGSVEFRLLRPGNYIIKTNYCGTISSSPVTIDNATNAAAILSLDVPILYVRTLYNRATDPKMESAADTIITIYDASGNAVAGSLNGTALDRLTIGGLVSGNSYSIGIARNNGTTGEYGLYAGFARLEDVATTYGRGGGTDDTFEENDTLASAKPISVGTSYGLYLGDADYFSFVMP